jgi:Acetyltransferase (GNAT) domain
MSSSLHSFFLEKCPASLLFRNLHTVAVRTLEAAVMKSTVAKKSDTTEFVELPSGLRAEFYLSAAAVPAEVWNSLVRSEQLFLRHDYLSVTEATAAPELSFIYVLLYDGKKAAAALYFQVVHLSADLLAEILAPLAAAKPIPGIGSNWSDWLIRCREECGMRLLISGNNFVSGEYGIAIRKDVDREQAFSAMAEVVKHITKTSVEPIKISAVLVKDYYQSAASEGFSRLKKHRYHSFQVEPEMIVPLRDEWKSFDDYVAAMAKKYRTRTRSVLNKTAVLETKELNAAEVEHHLPELYALYLQVYNKARFKLTRLEANYFLEMKRAFPEAFRVMVYTLGERIVAFRSLFHLPAAENQRAALEAHFIGLDYSVSTELHLYQRMLYDFVADGIAARAAHIYLGRTAPEIKSTVGAVAHELVCCIRHRNGLSNQIIRPFIDYLKPTPWVPRNPFQK